MSNAEQQTAEELTAYLDGELDDQDRRRVEERLARDADYRRELQRLEQAWDCLDRLPRSSVDESFARTTIEMVAIAAEQEVKTVQSSAPRRRRRGWLLAGGGLLAASLAGFLAGKWFWPNPNEPLLRDLPVLENFDLLNQGESIDFLKQLDREGLFPEEADHAG